MLVLTAAFSHGTPRGPGDNQLRDTVDVSRTCTHPLQAQRGGNWARVMFIVQRSSYPREGSTAFGLVADLKKSLSSLASEDIISLDISL